MFNTNKNHAGLMRSIASSTKIAGFCAAGTLSLAAAGHAQGMVESGAIAGMQAGATAGATSLIPANRPYDALGGAMPDPGAAPGTAPSNLPGIPPTKGPTAVDTTSVSLTNPPVPRWNVKEMLSIESVPRVKKYSSVYLLNEYGVTLLDSKPKVFIANAQRKSKPAARPQY